MSIVTKTVQAVARNQFDCQSISGGQLENQPTGTGDHWDKRMYYPEALSGLISTSTNVLSPITLSLVEDSGWYKANLRKVIFLYGDMRSDTILLKKCVFQ